jgi:hypothetical protein
MNFCFWSLVEIMISLSGQTAVLANAAVQREGKPTQKLQGKNFVLRHALSCGTRCPALCALSARRMNGLGRRRAPHHAIIDVARSLELDFASKVKFGESESDFRTSLGEISLLLGSLLSACMNI